MPKYNPFTKKISDGNGGTKTVCRYYGTEMCRRIHNNLDGCPMNCEMIGTMMDILNYFETAYLEEEGDKDGGSESNLGSADSECSCSTM